MSPNNRRLRELGYSSDESGNIICHRRGNLAVRYQHERCAVLKIELDVSSKAGLELVEKLIAPVIEAEPRALVGRSKLGAVMLFRTEQESVEMMGMYELQPEFALVAADDTRFKIVFTSDATLDPAQYTWQKGKSPLECPRDSLAVCFQDLGEAVIAAAREAGALDADSWEADRAREREMERIRQKHARLTAEGYYDADRVQEREDLALVEGSDPDANWITDGVIGHMVQAARRRIALRAARKAATESEPAQG